MSAFTDYKEKKRIESLGLPKIWTVYSDRNGVKEPKEQQVINISLGISREFSNIEDILNESKGVRIDRYYLKNSPYEIDIKEGEISGFNDGFASGCGDLWVWRNFGSLSKDKAYEFYHEELERITKKYLANKL